ncbi:MAG: hypothetical protein HY902_02155 [Deltaproteobacteria bacterium]|nr:hypothetical protein [Deltaproteobacteria bacterium]
MNHLPRLLLSSANPKKLKELQETAARLGVQALGPADWLAQRQALWTSSPLPPLPEVAENGETFVENGLLKALSALRHARHHGDMEVSVLADDSGLCVAALGGKPGLHSARWADLQGRKADAELATDARNRKQLLEDLAQAGDRSAWFECTLVLAGPLAAGPGCGHSDDGLPWRAFVGRCHGHLLQTEQGEGGFGYDPLFWSRELGQTFATAAAEQKHAVSHRGRAMAQLGAYLQQRPAWTGEQKPMYLRPSGLDVLTEALRRSLEKDLRYADAALEMALGHAPQLGAKERQAAAQIHWHTLRRLGLLALASLALRGRQKPEHALDPRACDPRQARLLALLALSDLDPHGAPRQPTKKNEPTALHGLLQRNPALANNLPASADQMATALRAASYASHGWPADERAAVELGYTAEFVRQLREQWDGERADLVLRYLNHRGPLTLRVNPTKCSRAQVAAELAKQDIATIAIPSLPNGLWCLESARVTATAAFAEGRIEIQDEGSQRIVQAAAVVPGQTVLDWCAGAGGKTLALGAALSATPGSANGRLVACDTHADRLEQCKRRAERANLAVETRVLDKSERPLRDLVGACDVVVVDAPCSSSGALRRNPELRWHLDADWLGRFPAQQLAIARRAAQHCKVGGTLVYATCSLMQRENESVVADFLASGAPFELLSSERIGAADPAWLATHPAPEFGPDGFFVAVLRRIR